MGQQTLFPANDNEPIDKHNFWRGIDLYKLPRTASVAVDLGLTFFFTGEECVHGHVSPKYTKGGRCVVCAKDSSARQRGGEFRMSYGAARANLMRCIAAIDGKHTYAPAKPCKHGHMLRYVSSNNCVECCIATRNGRKEKAKEERLVRLYGIDIEQRDALVLAQNSSCAICKDEFDDNRKLHVDHCHATEAVRGLLCSRCNQGIGLFRDDVRILLSAVAYLQQDKPAEAA